MSLQGCIGRSSHELRLQGRVLKQLLGSGFRGTAENGIGLDQNLSSAGPSEAIVFE